MAAATAKEEKKLARDAQRQRDFLSRMRTASWASLVSHYLWVARQKRHGDVQTTWMREVYLPRKAARSRIRAAFWGAWTRRVYGPLPGYDRLGQISRRDAYILRRADRLVPQLIARGLIARTRKGERSAEKDDSEMQAATATQLDDITAREPSADRHPRSTRRLHEAGIPATPGSARARKRSGRR